MTQIGVRLSKRIGNVRDARMTALSEYIKNYQARYVGTQFHRSHFRSPQERTQPPLQAANRPERNEFPLDDRAGFRLGPRIRLVYPHREEDAYRARCIHRPQPLPDASGPTQDNPTRY